MRTYEYGTSTHVPAFLTKLWKLVTDPACDDLVSWSLGGTSFIIFDEIRFSKELLPMYFKHNNMASFVRQLNMYGFRKLSCIDQGGMHCYKNEIEFYHQYFLKGQEDLLELIKRKIPTTKSDEPKVKQEYINELITNIKCLRGKQDNAEEGLRNLRRENRMLWRHVNLLTDRYANQQAVLHQLLPFFMNVVRGNRSVPLKRKAPLMIDKAEVQGKIARTSMFYAENNGQDLPSAAGNVSNRGPVIHDVTEMEGSKMFAHDILCSSSTAANKECEVVVDSPLSSSLESSDHTNNSPYIDPGSMEALNILKCNFESNSLSPQMEVMHSPINATNSPLHLPSHTCPAAEGKSPVSNYGMTASSAPIAIIDETTSDVPLQVLENNFLSKIEDSCSESRFYSMDTIINNGASTSQSSVSPCTFLPHSVNPQMANINSPMRAANSPINFHSQSHGMSNGSVIASNYSAMAASMKPVVLDEATSDVPLAQELLKSNFEAKNACSDSAMYAMINNGSYANQRNTVPPNAFVPNKGSDADMNWLMDEPYSSDPSIENWLGQIFKSDFITGCNLPQKTLENM